MTGKYYNLTVQTPRQGYSQPTRRTTHLLEERSGEIMAIDDHHQELPPGYVSWRAQTFLEFMFA